MMKFHKRIIVINGKGGSGKDTLVNKFNEYVSNQLYYNGVCMNVTAIRPVELLIGKIRELSDSYSPICKYETEKSDDYRQLMHTLKCETDAYCDLSYSYLMNVVTKKWLHDINAKWLFVHIREPENIDRFVKSMNAISSYKLLDFYDENNNRIRDDRLLFDIKTLLIQSDLTADKTYGNHADDDVDKYLYHYVYHNNKTDNVDVKISGVENKKSFYDLVTEGMLL